jgi:hypothetical protein
VRYVKLRVNVNYIAHAQLRRDAGIALGLNFAKTDFAGACGFSGGKSTISFRAAMLFSHFL